MPDIFRKNIPEQLYSKSNKSSPDSKNKARYDMFDFIIGCHTNDTFVPESLAEIDIKDQEGLSLLSHAVIIGNYETLKSLIEYGADVNTQDNNGITPIMLAVTTENMGIIQLLLAGSDLSIIAENGMNVKQMAKSFNIPAVLKLLQK